MLRLGLPVAWGEQDQFGHVNNVVYFRYFEKVWMHYLARIGVLSSHRESGTGDQYLSGSSIKDTRLSFAR
ncbi:MAG: thioesterase family protein [Flavobacteriales bacterium]|nr:thioesterase family protein [Flavobacteriales bacterium]